MTNNYKLKIQHPNLGVLCEDVYVDPTQFKLFLKMIQGCLELKNDLTHFDGMFNMIHIPVNILKECIITTKSDTYTIVDHLKTKSK